MAQADKNNPLHGSHLSSPIRGMVFDVGSTIVYATSKDQSSKMRENMLTIIGEFFNWNNEMRQQFFHFYRQLLFEFDQKKLNIGTGSVLDEGWIHEPTVKLFVMGAIDLMCKEYNTDYYEILNDKTKNKDDVIGKALTAFRQPRIDDAKLIPGVIEFLQWLDKMDVKCAICSNDKETERFKKIIETKFDLKKYFDLIIVSAATTYRKPDIRVLNDTILIPWEKKYNITKKEVIFIGDKRVTDILVSRYCGIRAIQCKFYDRSDKKFKVKPKRDVRYNKSQMTQNTAWIGCSDDATTVAMAKTREAYIEPDYVATSYKTLPQLLMDAAKEEIPAIRPLKFNIHYWRPVVIGFVLLPKKLKKFEKRGLFDVTKHRGDIILKKISLFEDLDKQGPIDILVTKLTPWYFAAKNDNQLCLDQLKKITSYIDKHKTNLNFDRYADKLGNKNEHFMFVLDDPNVAKRSIDRWFIYETIMDPKLKSLSPNSSFQNEDISAFEEVRASMADVNDLVLNGANSLTNASNDTPTTGNSDDGNEEKFDDIYQQKEYHIPRTILFPKEMLKQCFDKRDNVSKFISHLRNEDKTTKEKEKEKGKDKEKVKDETFSLEGTIRELLIELNKFKFPIFGKTRFSGTSAETTIYGKEKDVEQKDDDKAKVIDKGKESSKDGGNEKKEEHKNNNNNDDEAWRYQKRSSEGHHMFIIPKIELMFDKDTLLDDSTDWIFQQYLDHNSECHKIYVLGDLVFATVNNSTPSISEIMGALSDNGNKMIFINSRVTSKKQKPNQEKRDHLRAIYLQLGKQLRNKFNMNCFGFDMIFRASDNKGYIVDLNFLPSYKSVANFQSVFIEWMLFEYRQFIAKIHQQRLQQLEKQTDAQ